MHTIKFYPVGNGACSQIILNNGKRILFDFNHTSNSDDKSKPEIDLIQTLRDELGDRKYFDVVAFTHLDKDHICGCTKFFELKHADKYCGKDRIKINELWVPAAVIIEKAGEEEQSEEFVILRQEARYRLKEGKGIKIFSRPEALSEWMIEQGIPMKRELFVDAGQIVDTFKINSDSAEFFCHSPYSKHCEDGADKTDRNTASLILNVKFKCAASYFYYMIIGDSRYEELGDVVEITEYHHNEERLHWDIFTVPHHCSYKSLSANKGKKKTEPTEAVNKLLSYGREQAYMVCSSNPIDDSTAAYIQTQPPHIQAKKCYLDYVSNNEFLITMEQPNREKPEPIVITITSNGFSYKKALKSSTMSAAIISSPPRAG